MFRLQEVLGCGARGRLCGVSWRCGGAGGCYGHGVEAVGDCVVAVRWRWVLR